MKNWGPNANLTGYCDCTLFNDFVFTPIAVYWVMMGIPYLLGMLFSRKSVSRNYYRRVPYLKDFFKDFNWNPDIGFILCHFAFTFCTGAFSLIFW